MSCHNKLNWNSSVGRACLSHTVSGGMIALHFESHQCGRDGLAAMLATKRSAGVTPEVNFRECVTHMPLPSVNNAAHSGFETRGDITRSPKQGYQ